MSIHLTIRTKSRSVESFGKLLEVVARRHHLSLDPCKDGFVLSVCRLGQLYFYGTSVGVEDEVEVVGECQTTPAGPGFHKAAVELADEITDLNGYPFEVEDETGYYRDRDFQRLRQEHFLPWLDNIIGFCRVKTCGEYRTVAVGWEAGKYIPCERKGTLTTPMGRFSLPRLLERVDREGGLEDFARDFFVWYNPERDALFFRNSALNALWEDCCFVPSVRSDADEAANLFILENLQQAAAADPTLPFPKEDYLHLCVLAGYEPVDVEGLPELVTDYPIGYRKEWLTYLLGNLSFQLPGHFLYFDEGDSRGYEDKAEENWHVVRVVALQARQGQEPAYVDVGSGVALLEEHDFQNGQCRLYEVTGPEEQGDEYVCQCQVLTEQQLSIFTLSCETRDEALRFGRELAGRLTATRRDRHEELKQQIVRWNFDNQNDRIVQAILAVPAEERDPELVSLLGRAYNCLDEYDKALEHLLTVEKDCQDSDVWFYRVGTAYYYLNRLEEAQKAFERSLELNPGDADTEWYIDRCRRHIGPPAPEAYYLEEVQVLDGHIDYFFGTSQSIFHELVSPDIHVDIRIIEPTPERNYYTLVTVGMGGHRMNVPPELAEYKLERAEVMISLPPDWQLSSDDERWYWPLRWLKILSRLPLNQDTWLGWGHTVPAGEPLGPGVGFTGVMLVSPCNAEEGAAVCRLPDGDEVNIYQVIPLYEEEINYKLENGAEALLEQMNGVSFVVDVHRQNVCR